MAKRTISMLLAVVLVLSVAVCPVFAGSNMDDATPINLDTQYSDSITDLNTVDYFTFNLPASGRLKLEITTHIYKTNFALLDVNGYTVWEKTNQTWNSSTHEYNLEEDVDLTSGRYYFVVRQYGDSTGAYSFRLSCTSANESFHETTGGTNNDMEHASAISAGHTYYGQIANNDTVDYYKFSLSKSGRINLTLAAAIYKTDYALYDANGYTLWEKTNQTWDKESHVYNLEYDFDLTAGTYYFCVRQYLGTGNYSIRLIETEANESFPETAGGVDNEMESANQISIETSYRGQIALNDAADFYRFQLTESGTMHLRITTQIYKTDLSLLDENGYTVWQKERATWNESTHECSLNEYVKLNAGTYYFVARYYLGTGNYQFSIEKGPQFSDVKESDFFYNPVMWAVENEVTGGTDATHFSPYTTVLRSDSMVFFWAAKGRPAYSATQSPFVDVKKKHWYYDAVMWAVENKITGGTDATHFSPKRTCSRSEILQFLYAAMEKPAYHISNPYSDLKKSHWYYDGAIWAYEKGLEKGENGKFNAKTPCTRGYVVTYLYRFITEHELAE